VVSLCFVVALVLPGIGNARQASAGDSVYTHPVATPELPLRRPALFPEDRVSLHPAASDSLLPFQLPRVPYGIRGFRRAEEADSTGQYLVISPRYHDTEVGIPVRISFKQYTDLRLAREQQRLLRETVTKPPQTQETPGAGQANTGYELLGADIGGQRVALRVAGNVNINARASREDQNLIATNFESQPQTNIIFNQKQNFNIQGSIGDRINVLVDYNSERDFQFENDVKLNYTGSDDDIVQRIDAGNISLSLPGTQLVTFSPNSNGLFGIRTDMKIGPIDVVTVASIEQGKKQKMTFTGGASEQAHEIFDYNYLKNKYFFLDTYYRSNFYPLDKATNRHYTLPREKIIDDIEVFKSIIGVNYETGTQIQGKAWVDPTDTTVMRSDARDAEFQILQEGADYTVDRDLGYIRMNINLQDNEILAVAYSTVGGDTVGQLQFDPLDSSRVNMKLLRIDNPSPTKPTWDLMFKNVYSLGTINLDRDGFDLDILDTYTNNNDNISDSGKPWLQVFGLDRFNSDGQEVPDQQVDIEGVVDLNHGEVFLPYLEPFRAEQEAKASGIKNIQPGVYNPDLAGDLSQTEMYQGSYRQTKAMLSESRFKLVAKYSNQSANINLPGFNIIEGSEEVKANGSPLQRGTDYNIDYFSGQVNVLNEEALKPGANLEISYETNEVFQLDKKVVMGGRAEYQFGENSFLAATGMYYSKTSVDDKVRVGQEPYQNFVWDLNGRYEKNLDFVTRALDYMPLIHTEAPSQLQVEGELAQVMPNPNLQNSPLEKDGVAYIDDFEGSKRTTTLSISKNSWIPASVPKGPGGTSLGYDVHNKGTLYWYNPFAGVLTNSIWPNKQTNLRLETTTTQILNVVLDPRTVIGDRQPLPSDTVWGGFMRPLSSSYRDQSESKYIELWMKGNSGKVHIDLGLISEDINGNNRLDQEDQRRGGILNGLLDEGEDIGLDGLADADEIGVYGPNGQDTLTINSPPQLFEKYGLLNGDPAGDNYKYNYKERDYRHANGMEGNGQELGSNIPDTEDLNRNNILDRTESYFSYTVPLDTAENKYFVSETITQTGQPTGWKLYRIPLTDFDPQRSDPNASIEDVQYARLWFSDFKFRDANEDTLSIAKIEIVGNEWLESGVENVVAANDSSGMDSSFAVTVINNEDNNDIYRPPEGVRGAQDRVYGITSKEQALVLKLSNLQQWTQGRAVRVFSQSQEASLVNYKYIKMFMHGDQNVDDLNGQHLEFFFRMGRDDENYYEYRSRLQPGWQQMVLDMDFLAQLKAVDSLSVPSGSAFPARDPTGRIYFEENTVIFADTTTDTHTELVVHGRPSLGKIRQMEVGARNFTGEDYRAWKHFGSVGTWPVYNGQIWLNELRVTGVSRSGGMAYRAQASLDLADVMSVRMSTNQVNADFHRVDNQWGDNMNTDGMDINVSLNAHKFIPESWGIRIPVHARYSQNHQVPKYLPGSDVLTSSLSQALPDQAAVQDTISKIEAFSMQRSYGTSFSKNSRSKFWLGKYTLDAVRLSYDVTEAYLRNETQKYSVNSKNILQGSYNLNFAQGNGIGIFKFLKFLPVYGEALSESKFQYKPTRLSISGLLTENNTARAYRQGARDPNLSYSQVLQRQFSLGYSPFRTMTFSFNKRMDSNVSEFRGARRLDMFRYLKPGIVTGVNENYSGSFTPGLASWLKPTLQYQSSYQYQNSVNEERHGVDVGYSQQASISTVLDLKRIKEGMAGGNRPGASTRPGSRPGSQQGGRPGQTTRPGAPADSTEKAGAGLPGFGEIFNGFLNNIQPINITYSNSRNGQHNNLVGAPGVQYRLGWMVDPDVPVDSLYLGNAGNKDVSVSKDLALRSGYNFTRNLTATFNYSYGDAQAFSEIQTTRNVNKDFFLMQFNPKDYRLKKGEVKGIPLPGWSIRWSGLEDLPLFQNFTRSVSLNNSYQGRYSANFRNGEQRTASYTQNLQPLLGLRMTMKNDVSVQSSYGITKRVTADFRSGGAGSLDISNRSNLSFSVSYQRQGGIRIPLPFLRNLNMNNNINFSLTFDYSNSEQLRSLSGGPPESQGKEYSWQFQPKIDYSFTNRVSGGIYYKYGQRFNKRVNSEGKPTTFSDFGLTVNIQIRG